MKARTWQISIRATVMDVGKDTPWRWEVSEAGQTLDAGAAQDALRAAFAAGAAAQHLRSLHKAQIDFAFAWEETPAAVERGCPLDAGDLGDPGPDPTPGKESLKTSAQGR